MFTAHQLRVFLRTLCNLDPYTFTDEVVEHFAGEYENQEQTPEEILASALDHVPGEKLTSFALRLALTGYVDIPREHEFDFLAEAETAFVPPPPAKKKPKTNKPTPINTTA
jgi:ParB family chromosome partitioning protein